MKSWWCSILVWIRVNSVKWFFHDANKLIELIKLNELNKPNHKTKSTYVIKELILAFGSIKDKNSTLKLKTIK